MRKYKRFGNIINNYKGHEIKIGSQTGFFYIGECNDYLINYIIPKLDDAFEWENDRKNKRRKKPIEYVPILDRYVLEIYNGKLGIIFRLTGKEDGKFWLKEEFNLDVACQSSLIIGGRKLLTIEGETLTAQQWSAKTGVPVKTIFTRLYCGWGTKRAVYTPYKDTGRGKYERKK